MANEFVARNGIITNGKIGIGLTGPSESLETIGNIKSYQYISTATNSVSPLIISSTTKVNNLNADLLDGMHLTDIIINTPSPTVLDKAYSAKYSDDHYMPIAFSTRYYYNKVTTTTATLGDKPGVTASNYMTLTTTNQTIDWNSAVKLKVSRTSANDITFNQDSIFNHKLYCSFDRNCTITFGFRRFVGATQIASNDTKVMSFSTNVVTAVDIQMISNLLSGNTLYPAGTIFTDEIFISQDTPSSIVSKYYCGVNVGGTEYFSWHSLSTPAVVLNTDQIANGAITIPKLAEDTYNWIDNKVSKSGDTMSGDLNMTGNNFINAGFEVFPTLPTTFHGKQITYNNRVYTWNGTAYINDATTLGGNDSNYYRTISNFLKPNYIAGTTPDVLKSIFDVLRADRTAFLPANQIIIEQSIDGGVTWSDAGIADLTKRQIFTGQRPAIAIPFKNGVKSCDCMLRITITGMQYNQSSATSEIDRYNYWNNNYVQSNERYCSLSDSWVWLSANADKIYCKIEKASGSTPNTWSLDGEGYLIGWSGGNYIKLSSDVFGGSITQITNKWNRRITFRTCSNINTFNDNDLNQSYLTSPQYIYHIKMTGQDMWNVPNNLAYNDHLYSWDESKNVYFPASVISNETINCDINNIEPTQTGSSVTKTSSWWRQYLVQTANFIWIKLKDLFSTNNNNYIPKIDYTNKKLVKSNINDDGATPKYGTNTIWHSGNDGSNSGLDADLLDGKHLSDMINGTINYISKFTSTASIGNSLIYDNGTNVGIGTASPSEKLDVNGNINSFEYKYSNGNNVGSRYNATNSTIEFYFN